MESIRNISEKNFYCLILAGGKGKRLWPKSRLDRPKQFIDFFGTGKSLLQQTFERFSNIFPREHIFISTSKEYIALLKEQLPEVDDEHILCEPIHRNTAPIAAWMTHRVEKRNKDGVIVISPADQHIVNEENFRRDLLNAMIHAHNHNCFLTMGIRPTRPEPGYGYIQLGSSCGEESGNTINTVKSFTEKPNRSFAEMFIESGEFLWNTGLFIASVTTFRNRFIDLFPPIMRNLDKTFSEASWKDENKWIEEHFATYPNESLESCILEHKENVCVKECQFGWADIGTWHSIYETYSTYEGENVVLDTETMLSNTTGCVISLPKGRQAIIDNLHDYIVVENEEILLITPRTDNSDDIVKLRIKYGMRKG